MAWRGGREFLLRLDQLAAAQMTQRDLHRAFRKAGIARDRLVARIQFARADAPCVSPQVQIHRERGDAPIMADQVGEQRVDHVSVEGDLLYHTSYYSSSDDPSGLHDALLAFRRGKTPETLA